VHLDLGICVVRDWAADDAESLARHANDRRIWLNLRDAFPHPYTLADARGYLALVETMNPPTSFAIVVAGAAVGGIGYHPRTDVERIGVEVGYWLGADFWGRGITTAALRGFTAQLFATRPELRRLFAVPFALNAASVRVLEKAGYAFEGRLRQSAIKDGIVVDQLLYAIVRDDLAAR
jgi:RimJ/RimL family protein N-acetyltransferase